MGIKSQDNVLAKQELASLQTFHSPLSKKSATSGKNQNKNTNQVSKYTYFIVGPGRDGVEWRSGKGCYCFLK